MQAKPQGCAQSATFLRTRHGPLQALHSLHTHGEVQIAVAPRCRTSAVSKKFTPFSMAALKTASSSGSLKRLPQPCFSSPHAMVPTPICASAP